MLVKRPQYTRQKPGSTLANETRNQGKSWAASRSNESRAARKSWAGRWPTVKRRPWQVETAKGFFFLGPNPKIFFSAGRFCLDEALRRCNFFSTGGPKFSDTESETGRKFFPNPKKKFWLLPQGHFCLQTASQVENYFSTRGANFY